MICCDAENEWILYIFLSWSYWVSIGQGFKVSFIKSIDTTQTKFNEHMWVISCRNWKADDAKKFAGRLNELKNAGRSDKFEVGWKDWQIGMRTWSTVGDWWKNWRVDADGWNGWSTPTWSTVGVSFQDIDDAGSKQALLRNQVKTITNERRSSLPQEVYKFLFMF